MPGSILDKIVSEKRPQVERQRQRVPLAALLERIARQPAPRDFAGALRGYVIRLIAEVKKASPSRGVIRTGFHPAAIARDYARGGAAAISVLTEEKHFQGSLEHLAAVRREVNLPLLRKDFVFDDYQVYESRAYGADALLLITAILSRQQLKEFLELGRSLGMGCLVEVHDERELETALGAGAAIIGINNRDLATFNVDMDTTRRLRPLVPPALTVVSESGIKSRADVEKLSGWGVNAVLIGEALVAADDIPAKMGELLP